MSATLPRDPSLGRYGRPVIKEPIWKPEIPFYFFFGGLAGASAGLAALTELRGNRELARRAWATAAVSGAAVSPALLIADLGRPARFLHMLRLFKVTSPMSVGSWVLAAFGPATAIAALDAWNRPLRVPLATPAKAASAALGLPLATYTAALIANTAVPAWHEARAELPAVFAAGAAASAGAAGMALTPLRAAAPARRLAVAGAAAELAAVEVMERRLHPRVARAYHDGAAHRLGVGAKVLLLAGGAVSAAAGGRSRPAAVAGAACITAGAVLERWSVFRAGFQSAADPGATIEPQRERLDALTAAAR